MFEEEVELPLYPESAELGAKGVRMVADSIEDELHWIFRPNGKTDVGIDGEIEVVYENRRSSGKLIAAQIKCGPSFFEEKTERGFIYRCRPETINYWLGLSLPVILCLCDNLENKIYWRHITVETVKKLMVNYKIEVPFDNQLNKENKYALERVFDSIISIREIVDSAIFKHLYERYKHKVKICPLMEVPRDFHHLSYISEINDSLYIVGAVIDKYGYFDKDDLVEELRLYHENRSLCGWTHTRLESKFLIFFVSECGINLKLSSEINDILSLNKTDVEFERLLLHKEFISATLIAEDGSQALFYSADGSGSFDSLGWNAFKGE